MIATLTDYENETIDVTFFDNFLSFCWYPYVEDGVWDESAFS